MDWITLDINTPADREAMAQILFRYGYTVRQRRRKDWRQTAEFVSRYFTKGRMAVVEGRLQIRDWTDKDGNKRRSAEVVADNVYFGDSKREGGDGRYSAQGGYPNSHSGYSVPSDIYPAKPDPDSEFAELTTDNGKLPF